MKAALIGIFFTLMALSAIGQAQDSILYFTEGDITGQSFDVEEILIRPSCACIGECSCCDNGESNYSENRFACTDAILAKNGRISLIKRGNFAFEPVLNGLASDRLNISIDGMKIFGACTDKMDPVTSYVEPNNMKSVDVEHGGSGSKFGSNLGGSVNMQTTGAVINPNKRLSGEVGAGFQSAALGVNGLVSLNYSRDRWAVAVNGVYRKFNNYRAGGGEEIQFTQFEKWNGALSGKFMLSDNDVVKVDIIMDEAYNIGYPALPMDVMFAKAQIYGLTYINYPSSQKVERIEVKAYGNNVSHNMDDTKRPNVPMHMDMPGWTNTFGGYVDSRFRLKKHTLTTRLDGYHSNARAEMTMYPDNEAPMFMLTWPDVDKASAGLYLQDDIAFNKLRKMSLNARIEFLSNRVMDEFGVRQAAVFNQDVSDADYRMLKNASVSYQDAFAKRWTTWITSGYAERAPSITEQYAFYIFNAYDGYDYVGQVDLKNEKALQADAGIEFGHEKISVRGTGFYYHIFDYILGKTDPVLDAMTIGANGVKMSANISSAHLAGGNLEVSYSPIKSIELRSVGTYTYGQTGEGNPLPLIPPFKNTSSLKWSYKSGFIQFEFEGTLNQTRTNPDFGESETPGYAIMNIRAGHYFRFGEKRLSLNGGIENLTDRRYRSHLDWGGIPRPGINGYLNVSFTF